MSAPNDFRFTSSNKEKVVLLINRKQGENYHMRPVKTRHIGFNVIIITAVRTQKSTYRGGYGEKDASSVSERGIDKQYLREKPIDRLRSDRVVTLLLSLLGGRERKTHRECVR